jgi:hypothetical protein
MVATVVVGDECRYCDKKGHWARECKKEKMDEQAHVAQVDEEVKTSLLVAYTNVDAKPMQTSPTEVHLDENKLFV